MQVALMNAETYYRPPSEAESFIVRVMYGCPHNKCTFCNLFKDVPCKVIPLDEVLNGIDADVKAIGPSHLHLVESMYLEGGDPIAVSTPHLLEVMRYAKKRFPKLERFTCYSTAKSVLKKDFAELNTLARMGLKRVFVGLESGNDTILKLTQKGCTSNDLALAASVLAHSGIEMDVSMMLGIGGQAMSQEHALKTAILINKIRPACIRVRTFIPKIGTDLGDAVSRQSFALLSPHETLRELRLLVSQIEIKTQLLSEHWSNYVIFSAGLPGAKKKVLAYIDEHLELPEESFRQITPTDEKS